MTVPPATRTPANHTFAPSPSPSLAAASASGAGAGAASICGRRPSLLSLSSTCSTEAAAYNKAVHPFASSDDGEGLLCDYTDYQTPRRRRQASSDSGISIPELRTGTRRSFDMDSNLSLVLKSKIVPICDEMSQYVAEQNDGTTEHAQKAKDLGITIKKVLIVLSNQTARSGSRCICCGGVRDRVTKDECVDCERASLA